MNRRGGGVWFAMVKSACASFAGSPGCFEVCRRQRDLERTEILAQVLIARVFDGESEGLTCDDTLDNITIAWLTNTGISGARLYWEYGGKGYFNAKGVSTPVVVSVFPDELYRAPRSWAERAYPNLIHYKQLPKGGQFAAWEQPKFMSQEMRAGFSSLRK